MMLSSMLDVINKRVRKGKSLENDHSPAKAVEEFLKFIAIAEKFDFGVLPCEKMEADGKGFNIPYFKIPSMTEDEIGFWFEGLIPLPADVCYYEFSLSEEQGFTGISGLLIRKDRNGDIWTQRVEGPQGNDLDYIIDGTWTRSNRNDTITWINDDVDRFAALSMLHSEKLKDYFGSAPMLAMYLTLMINSKTTDIVRSVPTAKQQSLRKQLKKLPLPLHRIVTIVPQRFIDEAHEADGTKGTHASPRIHWRRSHVRTYNRGLPNERKIVIARQIVGRRELGEVTHDYVMRMKQ